MTDKPSSPMSVVSDDDIKAAWAAIVGADVADICYNASIIAADLRPALEIIAQRFSAETAEALAVAKQCGLNEQSEHHARLAAEARLAEAVELLQSIFDHEAADDSLLLAIQKFIDGRNGSVGGA